MKIPSERPKTSIEIGAIYLHEGGLRYRVREKILDATGYESGAEPRETVIYEQLDAGKFPAGTRWVRDAADFLAHFEKISE